MKKLVFRPAIRPEIRTLISRLIKTCAFFSDMTEEEVEEFLHQCKSRKVSADEMIFHRGDPREDLFVIVSGEVAVLSTVHEERNLHLGSGDVFGEIALIQGIARSASVRAVKDSSLLAVSRTVLESDAPQIRAKVLANVARQLADALLKADIEIEHLHGEVTRLREEGS